MHNLDHSILHKIVRSAKKSILDSLRVVDINSAIFVTVQREQPCNIIAVKIRMCPPVELLLGI